MNHHLSIKILILCFYDNNGEEFDIQMNFKLLENTKYISDGDTSTITIKKEDKNLLKSSPNLKVVTY